MHPLITLTLKHLAVLGNQTNTAKPDLVGLTCCGDCEGKMLTQLESYGADSPGSLIVGRDCVVGRKGGITFQWPHPNRGAIVPRQYSLSKLTLNHNLPPAESRSTKCILVRHYLSQGRTGYWGSAAYAFMHDAAS
jgi:hypothetical protein